MPPKNAAKPDPKLRQIPSVDLLAGSPAAAPLLALHGRDAVVAQLRAVLDGQRASLKAGRPAALEPERLVALAAEGLARLSAPGLCRVINATGILLHTGLGRAVLPKAALEAVASEQRGYSVLEVDRATGDRNFRETHVAALLKRLTGAEAATVVNNNAGATMIALAALAKGRDVLVSRGQLVEIGGSFRVPEVMELSGARLVEVGTTNKTYATDYAKRIGPETALLMKVHTSNFRILGFTQSTTLGELVELGRKHKVPVMDDLGSGSLVDMARFGIQGEPTVQDSVKAGADVVCFSGDKLLGGPQAGILVGSKACIAAVRAHPLFRALRVDKVALTALEAVLKLYLDESRALKEIPTLAMLAATPAEIAKRAADLAGRLKGLPGWTVEVLDDTSEVGGGSVPAHALPTKVVAVRHASRSLEAVASALRAGTPCIFARVQRERVLFDVRTLLEGEAAEIAAALARP